ncbi:MAG: Hydrolase TatD [Candidatus Angelobacter sp.]|jgi:TatD DNase family protein|nr:Hydrolase TatD [Candidatus Angelobacter sp.]
MEQFEGDRDQMLQRAREAGVENILAIGSGTGPGSLDCAIRLAEQHDWIFATIGIHPHEAKLATESDFAELEQLGKHPRVIAWGEIGLDYHYDHSPRDVQRSIFLRQMEMARVAQLPIVIHCRPSENTENAWDDTLEILRKYWAPTGLGGILHCFTGTLQHMRAAVDIGFMISFSGNVTFAKAQNIRDAAKEVPLERMLIETDSPFLAPVPNRGKRNEPAFVVKVAEKIAEVRGMSMNDIAQATTENFHRFFNISESATVEKHQLHQPIQ